jgi:hypothetical protein
MAYLSRAACAALLAGVGIMATTDAGLAAVAASLTLAPSSGGGVYDYDVDAGPSGVGFDPGQTIILSSLSGVTGASASGVLSSFTVSSFTSTSVTFAETGTVGVALPPGPNGTLVVDSSVLTTGTVDYSIDYTTLGVGGMAGTISGTVDGPVASAVPEPSTWVMALLGWPRLRRSPPCEVERPSHGSKGRLRAAFSRLALPPPAAPKRPSARRPRRFNVNTVLLKTSL